MNGRQIAGPRIQHRRFGAKQVGNVVHPGLIAVLGDAKTFFGFCYRRFRHVDALFGGSQIGVGAPNLQPDRGTGAFLLRFTAAQ